MAEYSIVQYVWFIREKLYRDVHLISDRLQVYDTKCFTKNLAIFRHISQHVRQVVCA